MKKCLLFSLGLGLAALVLFSFGNQALAQNSVKDGDIDSLREAVEAGLSRQEIKDLMQSRQNTTNESTATSATIGATAVAPTRGQTHVATFNPVFWWDADYAYGHSGEVYAVWADEGNALYFKSSLDGGKTWSSAKRIDRLSGTITVDSATPIQITTDGNGNLAVVWCDTRNGPAKPYQVFVNTSRDRGLTWTGAKVIDSASNIFNNVELEIAFGKEGNLYVVWPDSRKDPNLLDMQGISNIYFAHSYDYGKTWGTEVLIDDSSFSYEYNPSLSINGDGSISVLWHSTRNITVDETDIFYARSTNQGQAWTNDLRINTNAAGTEDINGLGLNICSDKEGHVYVTYGSNDTERAYVRASDNFGVSFASPKTLGGYYDGDEIAIDCNNNGKAIIVFSGGPNITDHDMLVITRTDNAGNTWSGPKRIDIGNTNENDLAYSSVALDSKGNAIAIWADRRFDPGDDYEGFYNYSNDFGASWGTDKRIFSGTPGTRDIYLTRPSDANYQQGVGTNNRNIFQAMWVTDDAAVGPGLWHGDLSFGSSDDTMTRLWGDNRIQTGIAISQDAYPTAHTASAIVVATSQAFPDALGAGPLAAIVDGPILINPQGSLDVGVANEIKRVFDNKADSLPDVYIVGGTSAISSKVASQIDALHPNLQVVRLGGADRYETSVLISKQIDKIRDRKPSKVLITTGENFADALSGSAPGSDPTVNENFMPIILTRSNSLPLNTATYLVSITASVDKGYILGGTAAVSAEVEHHIKDFLTNVSRIAGSNRYETAYLVAERFYKDKTAPISFGVAVGDNYPDALTGGRHSGLKHQPLLLVRQSSLPTQTYNYLDSHKATIEKGYIYGGTSVIDNGVRAQLQYAY